MRLIYLTLMNVTMSDFVPVYKFAKANGVSAQTVYRWIRERKIPEENVKREKVTVERIRIKHEKTKEGKSFKRAQD